MKQYEAIKEERLHRFMGSLSIEVVVSGVVNECVEAVCLAAECDKRGIKKKSGLSVKKEAESVKKEIKPEKIRPPKRKYLSST